MAPLLAVTIVVVILLQLAPVQQFLAGRITSYLSDKLQTHVSVGRFTTDWSNTIVLKEFYIEDQQQDTLFYTGRLGLDVNFLALLNNKVILKSARIDNGVLNLHYSLPDSIANFSFIRKAFNGTSCQSGDKSTSFVLKLGTVRLNNVRLAWKDAVRGNYIQASIGRFTANMQQFDSGKAVYRIKRAALADSKIYVLRTKWANQKSTSVFADAGFKNFAFRNVFFKYHNQPAATQLALKIGRSEISARNIDLKNKEIRLKHISVSGSAINYQKRKPQKANAAQLPVVDPGGAQSQLDFENLDDWKVSLNKLNLEQVSLLAANKNSPVKPAGLDPNYVNITGISLKLKNLDLENGKLQTDLRRLKFTEKSGLRIENLKGSVRADRQSLAIRKLELRTGGSLLQAAILVKFPVPEATTKTSAGSTFTATIISPGDIAYFARDLSVSPVFQKIKEHRFTLKGQLSGQLDNIKAAGFSLKAYHNTNLNFSGSVRNLTSKNGKEIYVQLHQFTTSGQDIKTMLPAGTIPETLTLPGKITAKGGFVATPGNLVLNDLHMKASDGTSLHINGFIHGQTGLDRRLNLEIKRLATTRKALEKILPKGALAPEIKLPQNIVFAGKLKGPSLRHFNSAGNFQTSYGSFQTTFNLQPGQRFNGSLRLKDFHVGKLFSLDPDLSTATGDAEFTGAGFKINTMVLHFKAFIRKITYEKEHFRNIEISGTLDKNMYAINGNIKNIVMQGLGHKLKKVKKLKPKKLGVKKIFGRKKKQ